MGHAKGKQGHSGRQLSGHQGFLKEEPSCVGLSSSLLVGLLVAVSYGWPYVYSGWMSFEMDASAIKSLMSGTYTTIRKLNIRHLHY